VLIRLIIPAAVGYAAYRFYGWQAAAIAIGAVILVVILLRVWEVQTAKREALRLIKKKLSDDEKSHLEETRRRQAAIEQSSAQRTTSKHQP